MSKKIIRNDKKTMVVFTELLTTMVENNTDNVEISFDVRGFFVKFKIELLKLKQKGVNNEKKSSE